VHGHTNEFVAARNRSVDRIAERKPAWSELELLTEHRATRISPFAIPTQGIIQNPRILFTAPKDRFESVPTLFWTGRHIVHHNLNIELSGICYAAERNFGIP
jgi:hypothetical protein